MHPDPDKSHLGHACGAECLLDSRAENPKRSYGFRLNQESSKPPHWNVRAFAPDSSNDYPIQDHNMMKNL